MRLVKQKYKKDCVLATLSMATGIAYEKLRKLFFADHDFMKDGTTAIKEMSVLKALGCRPRKVKKFKDGTPAILTVDSLNQKGMWHAIFFDGKRIWDPNTGREGKRSYLDVGNEDVHAVILFRKPSVKWLRK